MTPGGRLPVRALAGAALAAAALGMAVSACWENPTFGPDVTTGTVARVDLRPGNLQVIRGEASGLRAVVLDSAGVELEGVAVRWEVEDTTVASVDPGRGQVRGLSIGRTRVTARAGEASDRADVAVLPPFVGPDADHSCARTAGGGVACWGRGTAGQLGGGVLAGSPEPVAVESLSSTTGLAVGSLHSCALDADGAAWCWGRGDEGQLGHGALGTEPAPVAVGSGHRYSEIAAGGRHTCAVEGQETYCWGWNRYGQLGLGHQVGLFLPGEVVSDRPLHGIAAGGAHTCGLGPGGAALCWGRNADGQVGDGSRTERTRPVEVAGGRSFTALAAGSAHTCGLDTAGAAWCWGSDKFGQLGDGGGTGGGSAVPVPVAGGRSFEVFAAGGAHTCALDSAGVAWCWGLGAFGQLGPEAGSADAPVAVDPSLSFRALAAGSGHTCGVTPGGAAWCWGLGIFGQLGTGRRESSAEPRRVTGGISFIGFGAGG